LSPEVLMPTSWEHPTRIAIDQTPEGDELADISICVMSLANRCEIDLEAAFRGKEERNHRRQWTR
jgi:hypothetical protein